MSRDMLLEGSVQGASQGFERGVENVQYSSKGANLDKDKTASITKIVYPVFMALGVYWVSSKALASISFLISNFVVIPMVFGIGFIAGIAVCFKLMKKYNRRTLPHNYVEQAVQTDQAPLESPKKHLSVPSDFPAQTDMGLSLLSESCRRSSKVNAPKPKSAHYGNSPAADEVDLGPFAMPLTEKVLEEKRSPDDDAIAENIPMLVENQPGLFGRLAGWLRA